MSNCTCDLPSYWDGKHDKSCPIYELQSLRLSLATAMEAFGYYADADNYGPSTEMGISPTIATSAIKKIEGEKCTGK